MPLRWLFAHCAVSAALWVAIVLVLL